MSDNSLISIIIPHYQGKQILYECLRSLQQHIKNNYEIIIVDNNSLDSSLVNINTDFKNIKVVHSNINRGYAGGCNFGSLHAKGDYLIFLNNDTYHTMDWIQSSYNLLRRFKNVSSVQPKILNFYEKNKFDYAGGSGGFIDYLCYPFVRGRLFNYLELDSNQYDDACKIFWASGTAFITKKEIFNQIGGFDEFFFCHMEEIDYHWKCQSLGYEVWSQPEGFLYHKGGQTLNYGSSEKIFYNHRNSLILLLVYSNSVQLFYYGILRFSLEFLTFIKYFMSFQFRACIALIKAWLSIIAHYDYIINKRKKRVVTQHYDLNSKVEVYQKSIVLKYFLLGVRKFSELKFTNNNTKYN